MGFVFLLNALCLLIGNAIGRGTGSFRSLWAASVIIGVPTAALGSCSSRLVASFAGPKPFASMATCFTRCRAWRWIVPGAGGHARRALRSISVFVLWGLALNYMALRHTAEVKGAVAWNRSGGDHPRGRARVRRSARARSKVCLT